MSNKVVVERVWSYPENVAFYLEKCAIYVQIRNKSDRTVQIEKVGSRFECEDDMEPYIPEITPLLTLGPGRLSRPITLEFEADLAFRSGTNCYVILVQYRDNGVETFEYNPWKTFIFNRLGPADTHFFISHKDPEDSDTARLLARFLNKLGLTGYLSEDDHRPGVDLWEKIPPVITSSVGVIILWTSQAQKHPDNIRREIDIAKRDGKPLIMALEQGLRCPAKFPKTIEYFRFEKLDSPAAIKQLACAIENTYGRGGYSSGSRRR